MAKRAKKYRFIKFIKFIKIIKFVGLIRLIKFIKFVGFIRFIRIIRLIQFIRSIQFVEFVRPIIIAIISLIFFYSCTENTELAKCELGKGKFIDGQHFILSDIMNDDKKIDYHKWYRQLKDRINFQPYCIPIEKKRSFAERLDDLTEVADLSR